MVKRNYEPDAFDIYSVDFALTLNSLETPALIMGMAAFNEVLVRGGVAAAAEDAVPEMAQAGVAGTQVRCSCCAEPAGIRDSTILRCRSCLNPTCGAARCFAPDLAAPGLAGMCRLCDPGTSAAAEREEEDAQARAAALEGEEGETAPSGDGDDDSSLGMDISEALSVLRELVSPDGDP